MGCGSSKQAGDRRVVAPVSILRARASQDSDDLAQPKQKLSVVKPSNESERIKTLHNLSILDSLPDPKYEDITRLVTTVFNVPIAAVTLVDKDRLFFKSLLGLQYTNRQMDRNQACFCSWAVAQKDNEVLVVDNAAEDARFADYDIVTRKDKPVKFYAGAPLVADGHKIGTLCMLGYEPRKLTAQDCTVLCNLAGMVVKQMQRDQLLLEKETSGQLLQRRNSRLNVLLNSLEDSIMLCEYDMGRKTWIIRFVNQPWMRLTEIAGEVAKGADLWSIFNLTGFTDEEACRVYEDAAERDTPFSFPVTLKDKADSESFTMIFRPAAVEVTGTATAIPAHIDVIGDDHTRYLVSVRPALVPTNSSRLLGSARGSRRTSLLLQSARQPFDDVKLGPLLGKGGFGRVYRAVWNGAAVACKIIELPPHAKATVAAAGHEGQEDLEGMPVEALLGMDMAHPNVVQTYRHTSLPSMPSADLAAVLGASGEAPEASQQPREVWLLLEYCNKGTLRDGIDRGWFRTNRSAIHGLPDIMPILATAREVASGMAHLHSMNILHGDLTSLNVLLTSSDIDNRGFIAKVADFGLSRVCDEAHVETKTYGTVTHMPPELLLEGKLSKSADVYAYGVLLFELFTADRPWSGLRHAEVLHKVAVQHERLQLPEDTPQQFLSAVMGGGLFGTELLARHL
ncbi:hypothetical protein ABBQ38_002810 [Trebouxia sp. C0009 RCD-2024]